MIEWINFYIFSFDIIVVSLLKLYRDFLSRLDSTNLFLTDFNMGLTEADVETILKKYRRIKKRE